MLIHRIPLDAAFAALRSGSNGLSQADAAARHLEFGPNRIERFPTASVAIRFIAQFTHFFAVLLWIAALLALVADRQLPGHGMATLALAIIGVVVINGSFSFWQEYRAEETMAALQRLLPHQVKVQRGGTVSVIPSDEVVPGDVIFLAAGDDVPADCRLLEAFGVRVNNATVTGEARLVSRDTRPGTEDDLLKSRNVLLAGTSITAGEAKALVFATGMRTAFGRITHLTQTTVDSPSPLQKEIARLSRVIAGIAIAIGVVVFLIGQVTGMPTRVSLMFAIGIIVANVPEGLLPTVTLAMAMAMAARRMARRQTTTWILLVLCASLAPLDRNVSGSGAPEPGSLRPSDRVQPARDMYDETSRFVQDVVDGPDASLGGLADLQRAELKVLYRSCGYVPLWLDSAGRPHHDARAALELLNAAADEGLSAPDYYQTPLHRLTTLLRSALPAPPRERARFDVALSLGMLRYLRHVHIGRVDPRTIGFRLTLPADRHDYVALLRAAIADHRVTAAAEALRPPLAQYGALKVALRAYRSLAAAGSLEAAAQGAKPVRPGESFAEAGTLFRQLVSLGDIPADAAAPADARYDGALVEGVKRFQARHGLGVDGIVGKDTKAALRVPLTWRVRQIELALERLRWLPHLGGERLVLMNIPMFRLWAWDSVTPDARPSLEMDVIVGRALSTQTPVFAEQMREVIFRPYWNVPRSILQHEILPILTRDPEYLQRQAMEIVSGRGDAAPSAEVTAENIARLRSGVLRVRQRPGPQNALGLIKFVFPNEQNVYMHGTPAQELFNRNRRDFSHGCVRLRDPVALAEWVLNGQPEWNRDRILASIVGAQSVHVKLTRPLQVILFYTTAAVTEGGTIRFAQDIYRHDERLDRALR